MYFRFMFIPWLILFFYAIFILWMVVHWVGLKPQTNKSLPAKHHFSILIPYRNEEKTLQKCMKSVLAQNYPRNQYELLALNDHSTDNSPEIVETIARKNPEIRPINLTKTQGKKEALELGVSKSEKPWVITLDADCLVGKNWLMALDQYLQENEKQYVVMPVKYNDEKNIFQKIQSLEFLTLISTSAACIQGGKPLMSNGANVAVTRAIFEEVSGYEDNKHISSGDDVFLMQKIHRLNSGSVGYLHSKAAMAITHPVSTVREFINQRIRWGSKSTAYQSVFAKGIAILILAINLMLLATFTLALAGAYSWFQWLILFGTKFVLDALFVFLSTPFYGKEKLIFFIPALAVLYPIYIFVVSILGLIYKPQWKGRKIMINHGQK